MESFSGERSVREAGSFFEELKQLLYMSGNDIVHASGILDNEIQDRYEEDQDQSLESIRDRR